MGDCGFSFHANDGQLESGLKSDGECVKERREKKAVWMKGRKN